MHLWPSRDKNRLTMISIYELNSGDHDSCHVLLQQCRLLKQLLMAEVQKGFESFARDAPPLLNDGARQLRRATEQEWLSDFSDSALQDIRDLRDLCELVEQLLRTYQRILAPTHIPLSKDDDDMVP